MVRWWSVLLAIAFAAGALIVTGHDARSDGASRLAPAPPPARSDGASRLAPAPLASAADRWLAAQRRGGGGDARPAGPHVCAVAAGPCVAGCVLPVSAGATSATRGSAAPRAVGRCNEPVGGPCLLPVAAVSPGTPGAVRQCEPLAPSPAGAPLRRQPKR